MRAERAKAPGWRERWWLCATYVGFFSAYSLWPFLGSGDAVVVGDGGAAMEEAIRRSARSAGFLFLVSYAASPLAGLGISTALRRNRRYFGFAAGSLHLLHAALLVTHGWQSDWQSFAEVPPSNLVGGMLIYLLMVGMMLTSFDRAARRIGPRAWRVLHGVGAIALYVNFTLAFAARGQEEPAYWLLVAGYVSIVPLRLLVRWRRA